MLLIHGMAGSSRTWRDVMPRLAERFTVVAPDLLGHGESAKPLGDYSLGAHASGLRDLLSALGIQKATLVGQSLGGGVAMQLAYQHPGVAERLVLVSSGGLGRDVSRLLRLFTLPGIEYVMPALFPTARPRARGRGRGPADALGDPRTAPGGDVACLRLALGGREPSRLREDAPGGRRPRRADRVGQGPPLPRRSALPTMIVWGDRDPIIPVRHAHDAHELMPDSRLEVFENAGHFPHVEFPERFTAVLEDFLLTTEPHASGFEDFHEILSSHSA